MFLERGYEVVTVDIDPIFTPTFQVDILEWKYWEFFSPGDFDVISCGPPCTEFSQANTRGVRALDYADSLVKKGLEIIQFFRPRKWFLENPRTGLLKGRPYMKGIAYVDVDYCCFSDWGYQKPTRIWGSNDIGFLENILCNKEKCPNIQLNADGVWGHIERLGRTPVKGRRKLQGKALYAIPPGVIRYLMGWKRKVTKSHAIFKGDTPWERGLVDKDGHPLQPENTPTFSANLPGITISRETKNMLGPRQVQGVDTSATATFLRPVQQKKISAKNYGPKEPDAPIITEPENLGAMVNYVAGLNLEIPIVRFEKNLGEQEIEEIARALLPYTAEINFIKGAVEARDPMDGENVEKYVNKFFKIMQTVFSQA